MSSSDFGVLISQTRFFRDSNYVRDSSYANVRELDRFRQHPLSSFGFLSICFPYPSSLSSPSGVYWDY